MAQTNQYLAKLCCTNFKNIRKYIRVQRGSLSRYYSFCHYLTLINDSFNRMLKGEKRKISGFLLEGSLDDNMINLLIIFKRVIH